MHAIAVEAAQGLVRTFTPPRSVAGMTELRTMVQTQLAVNTGTFVLAQNQDLDDLKRRIEAAVDEGGRFVEFTVVGNRAVSVLVTPITQIALTVETVQLYPRDTGDADFPYGGHFDY